MVLIEDCVKNTFVLRVHREEVSTILACAIISSEEAMLECSPGSFLLGVSPRIIQFII